MRLDPPPCYVKLQSGSLAVLAWEVHSTSHEESAHSSKLKSVGGDIIVTDCAKIPVIMSELTKQQLRNELVSHGVKLPSPTAKKSEYVKIYEKYVAPVARSKGDFSSDDEDLPVNDVKAQVSGCENVCVTKTMENGV